MEGWSRTNWGSDDNDEHELKIYANPGGTDSSSSKTFSLGSANANKSITFEIDIDENLENDDSYTITVATRLSHQKLRKT